MGHELTFIHAADLHLDSPFQGLKTLPSEVFAEIKESTFHALTNLVDVAIEHNVDFVLITGDLFDNENQSLKAQIRLRKAFERLEAHNIAVYLSYGNHDYIEGNIHRVTYPKNVHVFPDEKVRSFTFTKAGKALVNIYGFSYVQRAVNKNKTSEYKVDSPEIPFHIAMLHGSVQGNTEHDVYAPFRLSELAEKDFDYWALGHIHKRQVLKKEPPIVYPGNIQGRHRKEMGDKGCYVVHMTEIETELSFVPLHAVEFTSITTDVSSCENIFQLEQVITQQLEDLNVVRPQLIDLTFSSNQAILRQWHVEGQLDEVIEIVNELAVNDQLWKYIFNYSIKLDANLDLTTMEHGEHFLAELERGFSEASSHNYVQELYSHRQARKFVEKPQEAAVEQWKTEARTRLLERLVRGGSQ